MVGASSHARCGPLVASLEVRPALHCELVPIVLRQQGQRSHEVLDVGFRGGDAHAANVDEAKGVQILVVEHIRGLEVAVLGVAIAGMEVRQPSAALLELLVDLMLLRRVGVPLPADPLREPLTPDLFHDDEVVFLLAGPVIARQDLHRERHHGVLDQTGEVLLELREVLGLGQDVGGDALTSHQLQDQVLSAGALRIPDALVHATGEALHRDDGCVLRQAQLLLQLLEQLRLCWVELVCTHADLAELDGAA
mmetsp:Transcript_28358/g.71817  ORF Transcript_28358/g.71817 Transcript_28358/m.71817 type:complete len:251 (-) Transcript_28358:27-779(-)